MQGRKQHTKKLFLSFQLNQTAKYYIGKSADIDTHDAKLLLRHHYNSVNRWQRCLKMPTSSQKSFLTQYLVVQPTKLKWAIIRLLMLFIALQTACILLYLRLRVLLYISQVQGLQHSIEWF
jgi:hypothetical protein